MKNDIDFSKISIRGRAEPSASLQEIAAYLRGVADATAALSNSRPPAEEPLAHFASEQPEQRETTSRHGPSSRRTFPYGLEASSSEARPRDTVAYPLRMDETANTTPPAWIEHLVDDWENDGGAERASGVCLRADRLSAEWYELVDTGVA